MKYWLYVSVVVLLLLGFQAVFCANLPNPANTTPYGLDNDVSLWKETNGLLRELVKQNERIAIALEKLEKKSK